MVQVGVVVVRLADRIIRACLVLLLSLAALVTGLAGVWTYTDPPLFQFAEGGRFRQYIDSGGWRFAFLFGTIRDNQISIGGLRGKTQLFMAH